MLELAKTATLDVNTKSPFDLVKVEVSDSPGAMWPAEWEQDLLEPSAYYPHYTQWPVLSDGTMPPQPDSSQQLHTSFSEQMNLSSRPGPYQFDNSSQGAGSSSGDNSYGLDGPSDPKRKKGLGVAGKSIEEELCRICGDRASGYHYNALSCEGCKGFFRRSITKTANYVCKYGGNCEMDMWMRRKCQACRLRRCREVGMKEECLLSEDQCKARDARRKSKQKPTIKKEVVCPDSNEGSDSTGVSPGSTKMVSSPGMMSPLHEESSVLAIQKRMGNDEHWETIQHLLKLQRQFEFPDQDKVAKASMPLQEQTGEGLFKTMTEMTVYITELIVKFAMSLKDFDTLDQHDQIILLKSASSEVMSLRSARRYEVAQDAIFFADDTPCTCEDMVAAGLEEEYVRPLYKFCRKIVLMETDDTEYALLTAICIFSERPGLKDKLRVEKMQSSYVDILQSYENAKRQRGGSALGKFLTTLAELRSIAAEHSKMIVDMQKMGKEIDELIIQAYTANDEEEEQRGEGGEGEAV